MSGNVTARRTLISLLVISAVHGINHLFGIFLSPLNEEIRIYFGAGSISAITAFKTTYLFVYALSNLGAGILANRVSARRVLAMGMVVNGAAIAGFAMVPPDALGMMHLLWALAGIGGGVYHPLAMALVTHNYPDRKGWALGITGIGSGLGFAFGPLISSLLARGFGLSWQELALIFGIGGAAFAVITYFFVVDASEEEVQAVGEGLSGTEVSMSSGGGSLPVGATGEPIGRQPAVAASSVAWGFLVAVILIAGTREIAMWTILDVSDFYLVRSFAGAAPTGLYLFFLYIPGIIVQPIIGSFSDRVNRNRVAAVSLGVYGLAVAALAIAPVSLLWMAYLSLGAAQGATVPTIDAIVADATPKRGRGMAFGVTITFGIGLGALGPLTFGLVVDAMGGTIESFQSSFLALSALCLIGAVAMLFVKRRRLPSHA